MELRDTERACNGYNIIIFSADAIFFLLRLPMAVRFYVGDLGLRVRERLHAFSNDGRKKWGALRRLAGRTGTLLPKRLIRQPNV
jgi:hypothetical protein